MENNIHLKVLPLMGNIYVSKDSGGESTTETGIVIPDTFKNETQIDATVLAVAEEISYLKVGDIVRFEAMAGREYEVDGVECLLIHETNLVHKRID